MNVKLDASLDADGNAVILLDVDGQQAQLTFTGTHVLMDVPDPKET